MDFSLNKEQEMFRDAISQLLDSHGQTDVVRRYAEGDSSSYQNVWNDLRELGYTGVVVPEEYGGLGLGSIDLVPILEEMGRALLPGPYLETLAFAVPLLKRYGTREQKEKYLREIAVGERTFTLAWLEPNGGTEAGDVKMTAKREGDSFVISGIKTLVPHGNVATTLIVPVRTSDDDLASSICLLIIDASQAGMEYRTLQSYDQTRCLVEWKATDVKIPVNQMLGSVNQGWEALHEGLFYLNAAMSASMVGGMSRVVDMSVEYANTRVQFGQPIGRFQAIKHRIVDMKMDLETARSLTYYANWALDHQTSDKIAAVASARSFTTEAYIRSASHNIQIHGGMGFTQELDCHLYLKQARSLENHLGTVEEYRERAAVALGW
jgi:alkylation response protein AidB-like acyl-CoA dehydrogenase